MKKNLSFLLIILLLIGTLFYYYKFYRPSFTIKLWDESIGLMGNNIVKYAIDESDINDTEITVYSPKFYNNKKTTIVICPGGAYIGLMMNETKQLAIWLQSKGYTAVVLKYRLPNGRKQVPLADLQQTIRYIKEKSEDWGISTDKIGVSGLSAGGHLATMACNDTIQNELRPSFSILFYPVISFHSYVEKSSREQLLGANYSDVDIENYSMEMNVTDKTPPTIIFLSDDDYLVPPENSVMYYSALHEKGVSASMYIFPTGDHGWNFTKNFEYIDQVFALLEKWLNNTLAKAK